MSLRRYFTVFLLVAAAIAAAVLILSDHLKKDIEEWEATKAAYLASGGSLDPSLLYATPVPDEDNFGAIAALNGINRPDGQGDQIRARLSALTPDFSGIVSPFESTDFKRQHDHLLSTQSLPVTSNPADIPEDIRKAIEKAHGQLLDQLLGANQRPASVFLPLISTIPSTSDFPELRGHPTRKCIEKACSGLRFYTTLCIHTGEGDRAIDSMVTILQLAKALESDQRSLVSGIVTGGILATTIEPLVSEGLSNRVWDRTQLLRIEKMINGTNLRQSLIDSLSAELVRNNSTLDRLENSEDLSGFTGKVPPGNLKREIPRSRTCLLRLTDQAGIRPLQGPDAYVDVRLSSKRLTKDLYPPNNDDPKDFFIHLMAPAVELTMNHTAQTDTRLTLAATACALERYRLRHHSFPARLEFLVPEFLTELPLDPMVNQPFLYERTNDGSFQLYSVGKDGIDGGAHSKDDIIWNNHPRTGPPTPPAHKP